jgi:phosphomannomutase
MSTLRDRLTYQPRELHFGTSGRRGAVVDLTHLEIFINVCGELDYLQSLPVEQGGIRPGDEFYLAHDLRPSSTQLVPAENHRGELCQAVQFALRARGMTPVHLGAIPTPALAYYALSRHRASIMVTGSHIPFRLNGYKLNTAAGELLKSHEEPVNRAVARVRQAVYAEPFDSSPFDERGMLKAGAPPLGPVHHEAAEFYRRRYRDFFPPGALAGMRVLVYQHSAVARDLLPLILEDLGAIAIPAGRSDLFVPIDTENIDAALLAGIEQLAAAAGPLDAVVSADGDSDRPLLLGVDPASARLRFFTGDLLGMVAAGYLHPDAVVVPVTCNDAIDQSSLAPCLEPKTRVGSPYVIAAMQAARARGKLAVCGWEANGGFLTGTDFTCNGRTLTALPTRDAVLPLLCVLAAARAQQLPVTALFDRLPARFSRAALLRDFPRSLGARIIARYSPPNPQLAELEALLGLGPIVATDFTDGVRLRFASGDVVHLRPSGNADEFRVYAVAATQQRADALALEGVREPGGLLRRIEHHLAALH